MKVLFISAAAPPAQGSHATRVHAFVMALAKAGVRTTLVACESAAEDRAKSSLFSEISSASQVLEFEEGFARSAARSVSAFSRERAQIGWVRRLARFLKGLLIPDTYLLWALRVGFALSRRKEGDEGLVVVSSGAPFSSHVAGLMISTFRRVPLILDYGDPWVLEPGRRRGWFRHFIEMRLERRALDAARAITVTTEATRVLYARELRVPKSKIYVLPMGFDARDARTPTLESLPTRRIRLLYGGRVNEEYRSLGALATGYLEALARGFEPRIDFYSSDAVRILSEFELLGAGRGIGVHKPVDHREYIQLMHESDALIVLGNNSEIQVPGKIAQFLAARRPVLYFPNLANDVIDPALVLLQEVMASGLFVCRQPEDFVMALTEIQKGEPVRLDEEALSALEWGVLGSRFASIVRSVHKSR